MSDRQRSAEAHDKTGVFTGIYVINPITWEEIPVFLADLLAIRSGGAEDEPVARTQLRIRFQTLGHSRQVLRIQDGR